VSASPLFSADFPSTRRQPWDLWLSGGESGFGRARDHVMSSYREPLEVYCGATGLARSVAIEPADVVNGFFASRLTSIDYLTAWSRSGMPLRNWLRNGIHLHVHELRRAKKRDQRVESNTSAVEETADTGGVHFERMWVVSVLEAVVAKVVGELEERGRAAEWRMFWQHHIDEQSHETVGRTFGCSAAESAQYCFRVRRMLSDAIAAHLSADGIRDEAVLGEILGMMEVLRGP
jgi:DNA-directed RNA polymerase specialized sigma24 family protein